jgi:hypothetical protein
MAQPPLQSATDVAGIDFVGFISTLAGILRRESAIVEKMGDEVPSLPARPVEVYVQRSGLAEAQNPAPGLCFLPEEPQHVVRGRGFRRRRGGVDASLATCARD